MPLSLASAETRRAQFAQANASLALEGMIVTAEDLAIQEQVIQGMMSSDEAVALYRLLCQE